MPRMDGQPALEKRRAGALFLKRCRKKLHALDPQLYLCLDLSQWGYFLNVDGSFLTGAGLSDLWDTAVRGADFTGLPRMWMRRILFLCRCFQTVTRTAMDSCQHSMMRNMNRGRSFVGGIYWEDLFIMTYMRGFLRVRRSPRWRRPALPDMRSYGMCGLDGGVLHRMPEAFCRSLEEGNRWWKEVVLRLGGKKLQRQQCCSRLRWRLQRRLTRSTIMTGGWIFWAGIRLWRTGRSTLTL